MTGGRPVLTSAAVGGGAPGPPKRSGGGNREGALSPTRSCARSDQAGASEPKKRPLEQLGRDKERVNFASFRKRLSAPSAGEATPQRAIRVIYGSLAASNTPHLHAGPYGSRVPAPKVAQMHVVSQLPLLRARFQLSIAEIPRLTGHYRFDR